MTRPSAPVTILLFASAREAVGHPRLGWAVPPDGTPADRLVRELAERFPKVRPILRRCRFVRNGTILDDLHTPIRPGDEFAVHPPYGGG